MSTKLDGIFKGTPVFDPTITGASNSFQEAIAQFPDYADAFRAHGKVLEKLSDLAGARQNYEEATRPALTCELYRRVKEVLWSCAELLRPRLAPEDAANHLSLGLACEQLEDLAQASRSYKAAIERNAATSENRKAERDFLHVLCRCCGGSPARLRPCS